MIGPARSKRGPGGFTTGGSPPAWAIATNAATRARKSTNGRFIRSERPRDHAHDLVVAALVDARVHLRTHAGDPLREVRRERRLRRAALGADLEREARPLDRAV